MRVLAFVVGFFLVGGTVLSAIRTVILPRAAQSWLTRIVTVLLALADVTVAAYAPWTSDRSSTDRERPRVRRFGSGRSQPTDSETMRRDRP